MKTGSQQGLCPVCGGSRAPGKVTYSVDLGFGLVVVRDVPAMVCEQCGEEWIDDAVAEKLEKIVDDARERRQQVAVVAL